MLIKVLGGLDLVGGIILIIGSSLDFTKGFLVLGAMFLIKSSIGMWKDFGSWIDLISGVLFFLLIFFNLQIPCLIIGVILIQKGIVSFI
jgi:hypothetical protein